VNDRALQAERPQDFGAIHDLHLDAFGPGSPEAGLVDALRDGGAHVPELCLVAVEAERVTGHILFSRAYYPRFGFEPADDYGVRAPWEIPPEAWMVHLLPAYRPDARGLVRYAAPFDLVA
jgi:predicted N-acetyltransferase YhbS